MQLVIGYRDKMLPPSPPGMGRGLLLALLVHAGLIVALAFGVSWRASEPEGIEAELWAAVPQVAAPRVVEPEPPRPTPRPEPKVEPAPPKPAPPDPQIAIEKEKQRKELLKQQEEKEKEKEKAEKAKADKLEAERKKKEEAREAEQMKVQREKQLQRILAQAGATGDSPGKAAQTAGPSAGYAGRIKGRVKPNITFVDSVQGNPMAEVEVRTGPDGTITGSRLIKSSGVPAWDEAVLRAIDKTEKLPPDIDGKVPSPMVLAFRPGDF